MGTVLPFDCRLKKIIWFVGNVGTESGSTVFTHKITKNGADLATTYTWAATGSNNVAFQREATPDLDFVAGDNFNLRLTTTTGYNAQNQIGRVRVVFLFEMREN